MFLGLSKLKSNTSHTVRSKLNQHDRRQRSWKSFRRHFKYFLALDDQDLEIGQITVSVVKSSEVIEFE